jgi:hypothetical protein
MKITKSKELILKESIKQNWVNKLTENQFKIKHVTQFDELFTELFIIPKLRQV